MLRKPGIQYNWTEEELKEYIKCSQDPVYFTEKYVKITTVDGGILPFELYDFQEEFIKLMWHNRLVISKFPRQCGKSSTVVAFIVWYILFNQSVNVAILAQKKDAAKNTFKRLKTAYENLPFFLQQGVLEWNIESIKLENESFVMCAATTADSIRSMTANIIVLDEFAHVEHNIAEDFYAATYPAISSGKTTKLFIISTPNGFNIFHKIWFDANRKEGDPYKNSFVPIAIDWRQVPEYPGGPLRGEKWRDETIKGMNNDESRFLQEFECSFIGTVNTLVSSKKLGTLTFINPIETRKDGFKIYKKPAPNRIYVATVDVSKGVGKDNSAITVTDCTEKPFEVVATWKSNTTPHLEVASYISNIGKEYNDAHVLVETNELGAVVAYVLHNEHEYENIIQSENKFCGSYQLTQGFGKKTTELGVRTSTAVKKLGCNNLKTFVENDNIILNDYDILMELYSFVAHKNSWEADDGKTDDQVMTLVLFSWLIVQPDFVDSISDFNKRMTASFIRTRDDQDFDPNEILMPILEDHGEKTKKFLMDGIIWETESENW